MLGVGGDGERRELPLASGERDVPMTTTDAWAPIQVHFPYCQRQRERERETQRQRQRERKRERDRQRERERERECETEREAEREYKVCV